MLMLDEELESAIEFHTGLATQYLFANRSSIH